MKIRMRIGEHPVSQFNQIFICIVVDLFGGSRRLMRRIAKSLHRLREFRFFIPLSKSFVPHAKSKKDWIARTRLGGRNLCCVFRIPYADDDPLESERTSQIRQDTTRNAGGCIGYEAGKARFT